jgi:RNA polymerase sigma-70 factor (subfamily 1)
MDDPGMITAWREGKITFAELEALTRAPRALYEAHCRLLDCNPEPWPGEEDLVDELLSPGAREKNRPPSAEPGPISRLKKGGLVSSSTDAVNQALEEVRAYLETLTFIQIDPRLRSKFSRSDIVQETLVEAWLDLERIQALDSEGRKRWLRRMLLNNLRDEIDRYLDNQGRDVGREQSLDAAAAKSSCRIRDILIAEDSSPSDRLLREEEEEQLVEALSKLDVRQRNALILQKYHGWKLAEIAEHLGCTIGAVAGLHAHGLKKLRQYLPDRE